MLTFVQLYEDSQILFYFGILEILCIDFKIEFVLFLSSGQERKKIIYRHEGKGALIVSSQ